MIIIKRNLKKKIDTHPWRNYHTRCYWLPRRCRWKSSDAVSYRQLHVKFNKPPTSHPLTKPSPQRPYSTFPSLFAAILSALITIGDCHKRDSCQKHFATPSPCCSSFSLHRNTWASWRCQVLVWTASFARWQWGKGGTGKKRNTLYLLTGQEKIRIWSVDTEWNDNSGVGCYYFTDQSI